MRRAFTLLELLVTVAIITLLAVVAVPGFMEAQWRSRAAETRYNLKAAATALENYAVDHGGKFPNDGMDEFTYAGLTVRPGNLFGPAMLNHMLTTPVPYLTLPQMLDPFRPFHGSFESNFIRYVNFDTTYRDSTYPARQAAYVAYSARYGSWMIASTGPDRRINPADPAVSMFWALIPYDPTNGAMSYGDIVRCRATPEDGKPVGL